MTTGDRNSTPAVPDPESWHRFDPSEFRIIIADDLEDTRFVLRRSLSREGYDVREASNGEELLALARQEVPDLVIADILMPVRDGLSALTEIRKDPVLAPIYCILLTGKSTVNEKIEGFQLGADDYVTKPYSLAELKARVQAGIRIKAMQRALGESLTMLARQEKLATIGVMATGIAHEFNNIMSGISGYAQLARQDERFVAQLIDVAQEQTKRASRITTSLSTFTKSGPGQNQITDARTLVDSATCLIEKELSSRGVEIDLQGPEPSPLLSIDVGQLQQALIHILLNAIQAAGENDEGHIEVRIEEVDGRTRIAVDDDGSGIPEESQEKLFDPFFTTRGALQNSEEPGNGLGLTFAQNIVLSHGGQVRLGESQLGGACFVVDLPSANSGAPTEANAVSVVTPEATLTPDSAIRTSSGESGDETAPTPTPSAAPFPGAAPSLGADADAKPNPTVPTGAVPEIVVVEDDPVLQELLQELFAGPTLSIYPNAGPAIDHCTKKPVDAVVLDLGLADGDDGRTILEALAQLESPPPVVLTTGGLVERSEFDYPSVEVLLKPYGLNELERAVAAALAPTL